MKTRVKKIQKYTVYLQKMKNKWIQAKYEIKLSDHTHTHTHTKRKRRNIKSTGRHGLLNKMAINTHQSIITLFSMD